MQIISEIFKCLAKARKEKLPVLKVFWDKRWFWVQKFSEYPMQVFYLDLSWYKVERAPVTVISITSPILFILKHFQFLTT
mmetsp:Transcript_3894/g.5184  ORF Transcript_3894/g.5184 Transcript_3894/m.5184 type:complete len:80 (+) Transcript_3894:430-669(+)